MTAPNYAEAGPWPVLAQGWDDRSIWGWDPVERSFYAQLWRNGEAGDAPHVALGTVFRPVREQAELARQISAVTKTPLHEVDQMMAESQRM